MKKIMIILAICMLTSVCVSAKNVVMKIDCNRGAIGDDVRFIDTKNAEVTPVIIDNRTLVPVRFIAEAFDFSVNWSEETQRVTLTNTEKIISLVIGEKAISIETAGNVVQKTLDTSAMLIGERTYLPLRAIAEDALGYTVSWDEPSKIISIWDGVGDNSQSAVNKLAGTKYSLSEFPKIDGSTATNPFVIDLTEKLLGVSEFSARAATSLSTTHYAYVSLIEGNADLIFVTEPSEEELQLAKDNGVELEVVPFSKEGFVFINHRDNIVKNLTLSQVKDIYEGKITNWKEVGGEDFPIIPYQREANSGSQTLMQKFMADRVLSEPPKQQVVVGMGELIDAVANYKNSDKSIGYSVYYFVREMHKNDNIKLLSIDGIMPNHDTIKNGSYPIVSKYYAVIRKSEPKDSPSRRVLEYVLSVEGQKLVDDSGLVSM